jgi:ATP-dependent helicase HepA
VIFVRSKENQNGIGKLVERNEQTSLVEYFDSPTAPERPRVLVNTDSLVAVQLDHQTRVYFFDQKTGNWRSGRIEDHIDDICLIALPNHGEVRLSESEVYTRWNRPIQDPCEHLAARVCETPFFHSSRAELLASFVRQRAASTGMTGILSAPIALERHQVEVVRRVLQDPVQRYLLADEVGLGKTIEAGVIIRQYVLDHLQTHRVLVIAPETLVGQWESELSDRCQLGEQFDHNVKIVALEKLTETPREQLTAGMVVVDEAHQAVRGWEQSKSSFLRTRFELLRAITAPETAPRLLLLSATPVRRNEDGFLALLHLLDPAVYSLSNKEAFREKVAKRQELADLFYAFTEGQQSFFLEGMVDQLAAMFPRDSRMLGLLDSLRPWLDVSVSEDSTGRRAAIRAVRTHLSETYRLHRRLLRNRRSAEVEGLLPGRQGLIQVPYCDPVARLVEQGLEKWRAAAAASIWNSQNGEESLALNSVFLVLLEAAACDLSALAWCVAERMCPGQPTAKSFARLAAQDRASVLQTSPHFSEEPAILKEILKAVRSVPNPNQDRIQRIAEIANEQLTKGFRVVVFSSSPALADQIFTFLNRARRILVFRHRLEDESWHSFRDATTPALLVCDFRAEEGLNLQGGRTCMIHADFPLSPNSLEQRMGRLDRFGVGHAVVSLAPVPEECPYQQAWLECLSDAYAVFSRSIAALQYVVEDEMRSLSSALLTDGEPAFRESIRRLGGDRGVLQKELKAIRAQDELDSIDVITGGEAGDLTASIEALEEDSARLEAPVNAWLTERLHFIRVGENNPKDNVARYHYVRPDQQHPTLMSVRDFKLWFMRAVELGARHTHFKQPLTWALSFFRETARSRKVGLGRIGNPVLDCLHRYLRWDDRGTCFAFWRVSPLLRAPEIQLFLRFDFVIEAGLEAISALAKEHPELSEAALRRRADAVFPPIARTLWLNEDLEEPDETTRFELARPYVKSATDTNINQHRWPLVQSHFDLTNWPHRCRAARAAAVDAVARQVDLEQLSRELATRLEMETTVVREQCQSRIEALSQSPREAALAQREWAMEMRVRDALLASIHKHGIRLDAAGAIFLAGVPLQS